MNYRTTNGWMVRLFYQNKLHQKFFSCNKYKGVAKAKNAAIKYRNQLLKEWDLEYRLKYKHRYKGIPRQSFSRRSRYTPIIGVCLAKKHKPSGTYYCWSGYYSNEQGKVNRKTFGIIKWGYLEAFQEACKYRYKNMGKLVVVDKQSLPEKPKVPYCIK